MSGGEWAIPPDTTNPLHRASFYLEHMKEMIGATAPGVAVARTEEQMVAEMELLLREGGIDWTTGKEVWDAAQFYGDSFALQFRLPRLIVFSLWSDGFMHGIAMARRLEADHPHDPRERR